MISICVPYHDIPETEFFLGRLKDSLHQQTYQDWELVLTKDGLMAENTNSAVKQANGEIIKILYMDDYLFNPNALQNIADNFKGGWMASGCIHENGKEQFNVHLPEWTDDILTGNNRIGSPSVVAFENDNVPLMDENLSWLIDCDWYHRLKLRFGHPMLLPSTDVAIGVGEHQTTAKMTDEEKLQEHHYLQQKYA